MKKAAFIGFLVYLILGLYFLNSSLGFIALPDILSKVDKWIVLVGSVFMFVGAINYYKLNKENSR